MFNRQRSSFIVLSAIQVGLLTGCRGSLDSDRDLEDTQTTPNGGRGGATGSGGKGGTKDAGRDGTGGAGRGGNGGSGIGGIGGTGGGGLGGTSGMPKDASFPPPLVDVVSDVANDACRARCMQPGGQYCGVFEGMRLSVACSGMIECPPCMQEGFVCGGAGRANVCGAPPDAGTCKPFECLPQHCGTVGDGCGGTVECPPCAAPLRCGGLISGVCGIAARDGGDCRPISCEQPDAKYCGTIGNGCGSALECGGCPPGEACGFEVPGVCGRPCPLCAEVATCEADATTVTGTAVIGALSHAHPLAGAAVYIPNLARGAALPPLAQRPLCAACGTFDRGRVVAAATTGTDGRFVLRNVPAGQKIPIVVQLGAWRRMTTIDVVGCTENKLADGTVRLPRNQREGDIPLTAIVTGAHDPLECLVRKLGIDDAEFTNPDGNGRIHLYRSNGTLIDANTPDAIALAGDVVGGGSFARYSRVLLGCEGTATMKASAALANLSSYATIGGRVLATHFGYTWLHGNGVYGSIGMWRTGASDPSPPFVVDIVTSIQKGRDFAAWLGTVGALSRTTPPQITIAQPHADLGQLTPGAGGELLLSSFSPPTTQVAVIDAPPPALPGTICGRVTFSDFHAPLPPIAGTTFPASCGTDLDFTTEEKALEYLLLGLDSCPATELAPPAPPPPAPPGPPPPPPPPLPPLPP